ncbi:MAG: DUF4914 family protein [bacterium]|nr:DUF4914 family protein [bacterium]
MKTTADSLQTTITSSSTKEILEQLSLPADARALLNAAPNVTFGESLEQLVISSCGGPERNNFTVAYDIPGKGRVIEAVVGRVRNGIVANYTDTYMRRRDPDCMVIADAQPTNKRRFAEQFGYEFEQLRQETFAWLQQQDLLVFAFTAGQKGMGLDAIAIAPVNCGFFAFGLALLQGIIPPQELPPEFSPKTIIYVAPPFRHSHFNGKQIVVHNRSDHLHEIFSYNLYPGPSAKKGIYGVLISLGEREGWVVAHCSTVQVVTPYDNTLVIMHEGASGSGKSEMLEQVHRQADGRILLGQNLVSGERRYLTIPRTCELFPVNDDMALCHPTLQGDDGKLHLTDAEKAWFVRVDHITEYGTDPFLEKLTAQSPEPLLFLNIDAVPDSRALIWEHIEDEPGKKCPNPRVIIPRKIVPNIINTPVSVDVRSFGVRTPPCTKENPSYGIFGIFHLLPPALAWLWRLVAPRGHANPSIIQTLGLSSEGVGSYWPFATGRRVDQANLLLNQIESTQRMRYIICPNQHIGAWKVGFMPQWIARDYLARRGVAKFKSDQIQPARCPLLGYAIFSMHVEGTMIPHWFLQVETQPEVGIEGYDAGAKILYSFFRNELKKYLEPDLLPLGHKIIQCCLDGGTVADYEKFIPGE